MQEERARLRDHGRDLALPFAVEQRLAGFEVEHVVQIVAALPKLRRVEAVARRLRVEVLPGEVQGLALRRDRIQAQRGEDAGPAALPGRGSAQANPPEPPTPPAQSRPFCSVR